MRFETTMWTLIEEVQQDESIATSAYGMLCDRYWKPLQAFARRKGLSDQDAEDAVQGFFLVVMEKRYLDVADASKGRFRTFLLTCFQRYLANEYKKAQAQKRGGHFRREEDQRDNETPNIERIAANNEAVDEHFDREWAYALIERAISALRKQEEEAGRGQLFDKLADGLLFGASAKDYDAIAAELGTTGNAVKVAAHRQRKRLQKHVFDEVLLTVQSPEQAKEELRHLIDALGNRGMPS